MHCTYCGAALHGFADSRIVKINADRHVACKDVEACGRRRAAADRARDADFGADGDATTPGFFRRAGE